MAFSDFQFPDVCGQFGLRLATARDLFAAVPSVDAGQQLARDLRRNLPLAVTVNSETARAMWLVGPVLAELWARYDGHINVHVGVTFVADREADLLGFCVGLIGLSDFQPTIVAPVAVLFEAKRDSIIDGLGQAVAGVVGMRRFNEAAGRPIDPLYGVVTTGDGWRFLKLEGDTILLDGAEYSIKEIDRIFGILVHMVGRPPAAPAA